MLTKRDPTTRSDHAAREAARQTEEARVEGDSSARSNRRTRKTAGMKMLTKGAITMAGIVVLAGLGVGIYSYSMWPAGEAADEGRGAEQVGQRVPVVLSPARAMTFEDAVVVSGSVQAKNYALVSARMPGPLDAIYVDEGDRVEAGRTQLFQTDSLKLTKALALARQALTVAECSVAEARARLEQALADKEQAERDLKRYQELARDNAVPIQLLEKQETGYKQAVAAVKDVEALIALREAQLEQARLSLAIAQKDLADSLVVAPISGRVSQRFKEPGEMAAAGTPVLKIEDLSVLEVSVFLPAEYYTRVLPGQTQMRVQVGGIDLGTRPVSYKSPTVNRRLRTFEVKGLAESPPPGVAPGCLARVAVVMDSRSGVGIPTAAIVRRGGHFVVFLVDGEKARMVQVKPGLETGGWTEILQADLPAGTPVVTMGQQLVEDGTPVSIVEEAAR